MHGIAAICTMSVLAAFSMPAVASETRSYVVSLYANPQHPEEGDCTPEPVKSYEKTVLALLKDEGKPASNLDAALRTGYLNRENVYMRGRAEDGKPLSAYSFPESTPDPMLPYENSKYAYGFNLDGLGAASPHSYEHPDTHEKGINNEYSRAVGCMHSTRILFPNLEHTALILTQDMTPAWIIEVSDIDDLQNDPDVTIRFYRATSPVQRASNGAPQVDVTYTADFQQLKQTIFHGRIVNGVLEETTPFDFVYAINPFWMPAIDMQRTRISLKLTDEGLKGFFGGYQRWDEIYAGYALKGGISESLGTDVPGVYYNLKKLADYDPDPTTGQNRRISATYYLEAIPAFVVVPHSRTGK